MAVTKPCCPVCWELMAVLRGDAENQFLVRSGNPTVYPIELPPWLPQSACEQMVDRFQKHLCTQLESMVSMDRATKSDASSLSIVAAYKKGHCHTLSIESDSDLSTTTSASDHSNDLATATTKSKVVGCLASGTSS